MGVQPTISYKRVRILGNACRPKLRALSKDLSHWNDIELGNILDMAVEAAYSRNEVEEWWEDDSAYGICLNLIVRVDGDLPAPDLDETYAVVRHIEENQDADGKTEIIITVIDKYEYEQSIVNGRWKEKRPEKSRYRHLDDPPEQEEDVEIPDGVVEAVKRQEAQRQEAQKSELVLIEYTNISAQKPDYVSATTDTITMTALGLIANGAEPSSIRVWTCSKRVRFATTLEE